MKEVGEEPQDLPQSWGFIMLILDRWPRGFAAPLAAASCAARERGLMWPRDGLAMIHWGP